MTAANQVTDLLKITARLIGVLEREIEMLRAMRPSEIEALQQDKIALTAAYEAQAKSLAGQPQLLEAVDPALRAELKARVDTFRSTLAANERALRAARHAGERVLRAIADEIDRKRREDAGYAARGNDALTSGAAPRKPLSVAVDQRL